VGTATGWTTAVRFPAGIRQLLFLHDVSTACDAQVTSHPIGTRSGNEPSHYLAFSAEVKSGGFIPPCPPYHHGILLTSSSTRITLLCCFAAPTTKITAYLVGQNGAVPVFSEHDVEESRNFKAPL
jgi:hypothetical protein